MQLTFLVIVLNMQVHSVCSFWQGPVKVLPADGEGIGAIHRKGNWGKKVLYIGDCFLCFQLRVIFIEDMVSFQHQLSRLLAPLLGAGEGDRMCVRLADLKGQPPVFLIQILVREGQIGALGGKNKLIDQVLLSIRGFVKIIGSVQLVTRIDINEVVNPWMEFLCSVQKPFLASNRA